MANYKQSANPNATNSELDAKIVVTTEETNSLVNKWALTYTFNYDDNEARLFKNFDDTLVEAKSWSKCELGAPIYVWKLTTGKPIKWMKVSQWKYKNVLGQETMAS